MWTGAPASRTWGGWVRPQEGLRLLGSRVGPEGLAHPEEFVPVAGAGRSDHHGTQFMEGSYGMRERRWYSGPFRSRTRLQRRSGLSVKASSARAGSTIQLSSLISASS